MPSFRSQVINGLSFYQFIYLYDFLPYQVFRNLKKVKVDQNSFTRSLRLPAESPHGTLGNGLLLNIYILGNFSGNLDDDYENYIFPQDKKIRDEHFARQSLGYGNISTFLKLQPDAVLQTLKDLVFTRPDGICIQIDRAEVAVHEYFQQEVYDAVTKRILTSLEVGVLTKVERENEMLREFEIVLADNNEAKREQFIHDNYQSIFGYSYDQITTQIFLKVAHLDANAKNRRLDIFLRNTNTNDWELFEIKRELEITRNFRDLKTFKAGVFQGIEQVRNYGKLLAQDEVKRMLEAEGIEYVTPVLHLVIGRSPTIGHGRFGELIESNSRDVRIVTYDKLTRDIESRHKIWGEMFNWIPK